MGGRNRQTSTKKDGRDVLHDAYFAGFFDGEGSVYAAVRGGPTRKRGGAESLNVLVCISNTNLEVLEMHKEKWGGSICQRKLKSERWQPQWQWVLAPRMALAFLKAILPHLVIKRAVVEVAVTLIELMGKPQAERVDYSQSIQCGHRRRVSPRSRPEYRAEVERLHGQIRELNSARAPMNATRVYQ